LATPPQWAARLLPVDYAEGGPMSDKLPFVVAEWPRNKREIIRVTLDQFAGQPTLDCRCWYADSEGGLLPSRSGITPAARHLPLLAEALGNALSEARRMGLIADN